MTRTLVIGFVLLAAGRAAAEPPAAANAGFDRYVASVESRLAGQHLSPATFLVAQDAARLHLGELIVERLTPADLVLPGAMLHHWRGSAFVPGATAAEFERLLRDFNSYPKTFAPQVLRAGVVGGHGDVLQASMRVRQKHVITVVMDTAYDVSFGRLNEQSGWSMSRSTKIAEIDAAGNAVAPADEHGFLWRQNTYWSYEERDGGLYLQVESVSLSRSIPVGLGWAVRPFVESVPRESLEFTLRAVLKALGGKA